MVQLRGDEYDDRTATASGSERTKEVGILRRVQSGWKKRGRHECRRPVVDGGGEHRQVGLGTA